MAEVGPVILNPKTIPAATQKIGGPHPFSSKNISRETTIPDCVGTEIRVRGVCDCCEQLLALVMALLRQNCSLLCVGSSKSSIMH